MPAMDIVFAQHDWRTLELVCFSYFNMMNATLKCANNSDFLCLIREQEEHNDTRIWISKSL